MVCYFPLKGYRSRIKNPSGKYSITFSTKDAYVDKPVEVPCGQCIGCRLERSRLWAVRCVHEASLHDSNCFLTLTYNDQYLPKDGSLRPRDFQLFMKRFRKRYKDVKIRFFQCGEYGEKFARPHHHACIFGFDFPDKYHYSTRDGVRLYRSAELESLWSMGYCTIGDVTFESAAYVARYVTKKITGEQSIKHYMTGIDYDTGEVFMRKPEYVTMSRRPGIARAWIEKFKSDVYPSDFVVIRDGMKVKPPRYYDNIYDTVLGGDLDNLKIKRKILAHSREEDNSSQRLATRHECQVIKFNKLKRSFENAN